MGTHTHTISSFSKLPTSSPKSNQKFSRSSFFFSDPGPYAPTITYLLSPIFILTYISLDDTSFHSVTLFLQFSPTIIHTPSIALPSHTPETRPTTFPNVHCPVPFNFVSLDTSTSSPLLSLLL